VPIRCTIRASEYHDSVALMEVARELTRFPGVGDAAVLMATEANKGILREARLLLPEIVAAGANDLIIVVQAVSDEVATEALAAAETLLTQRLVVPRSEGAVQPRTVRAALGRNAESNLAIISVAGQYAAAEAWEALGSGLHVLLFSDNVPIEDEIALKKYAAERGLLMMGPDCGTALINGVALGFANVVPRGPVGIVAASGTGLQEVSTLLAKLGVGITQGIGTGGRDLKEAVGGIMMLEGLKALQQDPDTAVIVLVSKPPSPVVGQRVLCQIRLSDKPTVICFLGADPNAASDAGAVPARTLQECAYLAAAEVGGCKEASPDEVIGRERADLASQALELKKRLNPGQEYLRGLFSGGTLASEALLIWGDMLGQVYSNLATDAESTLRDATKSRGHCAVDLGDDVFTLGRPHPMIDHELRIRRLMQEASDPTVAVVMLDVVLGYGAHPNPAGELGPAIEQARELAAQQGRELIVVASVTGTKDDPQGLERQIARLKDAGAVVCTCNAAAARLAGLVVV